MISKTSLLSLLSASLLTLVACSSSETKQTLADIDLSDDTNMQSNVFVKPKSEEEIKQAYYSYIRNASKNDKSRQTAINRIAAMELNLTNKILADSDVDSSGELEDELYTQSLHKAVTLLSESLRDFPDANDNDQTLYQLARTQDQLGNYSEAISALNQLVSKYPESKFYAEAQFRLGEHAFISGDFIGAEDAYTEVILTPTNDRFYEKSLFKRGWTRYKQQLYHEAVDDYLQALTYHQFDEPEQLNKTEKDQFDEYFRAIGLVFSHLRGAEGLNEYFADKSDFRYLFHSYTVVADIYLQQERFSDAVQTLELFMEQHPQAAEKPLAHLRVLEIWQEGNFTDRVREESEKLYVNYNPGSSFWTNNSNEETKKKLEKRLREYIVLVANYHHSEYQRKSKARDLNKASLWYERYLTHYPNFAKQDSINTQYANLLADTGDDGKAIAYFENAAYDGELILDKSAAYSTIVLSNKLFESTSGKQKSDWLNKHIEYSRRYLELYPNDENSAVIITNAAEMSYRAKDYESAIAISELAALNLSSQQLFNLNNIKARSYLEQKQYAEAESAFLDLLQSKRIPSSQEKAIQNSISLAIYRQAEAEKNAGNTVLALKHFSRISESNPRSELAPTGLYDAISLAMKQELWSDAIFYIESFQKRYPGHKRNKEISRQLSVAYLKSNQDDKAARQLERLAQADDSADVKMAALWQAAELYEKQEDVAGAIRSYRDYAHTYPAPYPQNIEAMYKLSELYRQSGDISKRYFWQNKIKNTDKKTSNRLKTDRTNHIAATTILDLAGQKTESFDRIKLAEPLAKNLKRKKQFMQEAIKLYGQASAYNQAEVTTQATYSIASIYLHFSKALLDSERPARLAGEELEQYNILLEDQAFPFEEKSIEFHETNLSRVKDGTYNKWVKSSYENLVELFPVRFSRKGKVEVFESE
ncbi:Outer membrane protein assembly factor BamD, BamD/ComL family [Alteromonadaceae bacterium Bs31]|nr:Outer membrane protein assembly factor BamD, BamD/ComL family [Alteromonadaceae bacterium Bs31]